MYSASISASTHSMESFRAHFWWSIRFICNILWLLNCNFHGRLKKKLMDQDIPLPLFTNDVRSVFLRDLMVEYDLKYIYMEALYIHFNLITTVWQLGLTTLWLKPIHKKNCQSGMCFRRSSIEYLRSSSIGMYNVAITSPTVKESDQNYHRNIDWDRAQISSKLLDYTFTVSQNLWTSLRLSNQQKPLRYRILISNSIWSQGSNCLTLLH